MGFMDISGMLISEAASFACLSTNSFPSIFLCPGTQCPLLLLFLSQFFPKLFLMSNTVSILFSVDGYQMLFSLLAYNQLVYECASSEYFPIQRVREKL